MHLFGEPGAAEPADEQDLINALLAAALEAAAALNGTHHVAMLSACVQPQAASDLTAAAAALTQIRDTMLRTADVIASRESR